MTDASAAVTQGTLGLHPLESYELLIGKEAVARILGKSQRLGRSRIAHISSTFYGGGVAEILTPLTLLMNSVGINTDWHLIQGTPAFFHCTKMLHNSLQGESLAITEEERAVYEAVGWPFIAGNWRPWSYSCF